MHTRKSKFTRWGLLAAGVFGLALILPFGSALAAEGGTRCLVVHVTQNDPDVWKQALNIVSNVPKDLGIDNVKIEVVAQGPGLGLLTASSPEKARVTSLAQYGSTFSACGNTMASIKAKKGKEPDLIEGVQRVQAGVIRVMELHEQGCTYVRP